MNVNICKFAGIGAFFGYRSHPNFYIIIFSILFMKKGILIGIVLILILAGGYFLLNQSGKSIEDIGDEIGELGMPVPGLGDFDEMIEQPDELATNLKEFDVIAKQWEFEPSTIEVDFGDTVILNIESIDVNHGIMIPEFGVNKMLNAGEKIQVEFIATKKGTFSFFCNVFCGSGHSNMGGKIIVN